MKSDFSWRAIFAGTGASAFPTLLLAVFCLLGCSGESQPPPEPAQRPQERPDRPTPEQVQREAERNLPEIEDVPQQEIRVKDQALQAKVDAIRDTAALGQIGTAYGMASKLARTVDDPGDRDQLRALVNELRRQRRVAAQLRSVLGQLIGDSGEVPEKGLKYLEDAGTVGRMVMRGSIVRGEPAVAAGAAQVLAQQNDQPSAELILQRLIEGVSNAPDPAVVARLGEAGGDLIEHAKGEAVASLFDRLTSGEAAPAMAGASHVLAAAYEQRADRRATALDQWLERPGATDTMRAYLSAMLWHSDPAQRVRALAALEAFELVAFGLRAAYHYGSIEGKPVHVILQPTPKLPGPTFPLPSGKREDVATRWTGWLVIRKGGEHEFEILADDEAGLWVGEQPVIPLSGGASSGHVSLEAGLHPVRLDYRQRKGEAGLSVRWSGPLFTRRPLSADDLRGLPAGETAFQRPEQASTLARSLSRHLGGRPDSPWAESVLRTLEALQHALGGSEYAELMGLLDSAALPEKMRPRVVGLLVHAMDHAAEGRAPVFNKLVGHPGAFARMLELRTLDGTPPAAAKSVAKLKEQRPGVLVPRLQRRRYHDGKFQDLASTGYATKIDTVPALPSWSAEESGSVLGRQRSVKWRGRLLVREPGKYIFHVEAPEGAALWLAGVNILSWPSYDQTTIRVGLDPGLYPLEVWGRQRGERGVSVRLSGPGLGETPVELEPAWIRCEPIAERVLEK